MGNIRHMLDKLYVKIIKVGYVAACPKIQYWLGCIFALASSVAHTEDSVVDGHFSFTSNSLNTRVGNVPGNRQVGSMFFDYKKNLSDPDEQAVSRRFTLAAQQNDQGLLQYSLQEAYLGGHITSKDTLKFGRQNLDWSKVDATWGFGKMNNRRNFDFFEPGQEGLVGLLYEHKGSNGLRYRVFASGLYVPETNPSYDINKKRKTIKCKTPWCDAPSTTTDVQGNIKRIEYNVNYPSISDVIFRYSVGMNVGYESKHWVWDNFYMRKPENNLTTKVSVNLNAFADVVKAYIDPQVYYHDMVGSNLKYRNNDLEMYVGGFASRPSSFPDGDRDATRATTLKTGKIKEDYVGGGISKTNSEYSVALNYVARLSPYNRDAENLSADPRWNQAVNVSLMKNLYRFMLAGDAKYDMLTRDRLVMVRVFFNVTNNLLATFGMNLIGTPSDGKSFWSPYTNNDALFVGLRYVY